LGTIRIANETIATLAGLASAGIEGVAEMGGGIVEGIAGMLSGKNVVTRGVKVEVDKGEVIADLFLIVEYGYQIPNVAWQVQEAVKESIEAMTDLKVVVVNIYIQGVHLPEEDIDKSLPE
jgi:uncharacterized alkaline shock family protein YloU